MIDEVTNAPKRLQRDARRAGMSVADYLGSIDDESLAPEERAMKLGVSLGTYYRWRRLFRDATA